MKTVTNISFNACDIPGGEEAILGPSQCGPDVAKVNKYKGESINFILVDITLDEKDERIPKVIQLLQEHGEEPRVFRRDIYDENDLQSARLLYMPKWIDALAYGGPRFGTTYDRSKACPTCSTGVRQTSPLIVGDEDLRTVDKHRVAGTNYGDLLIRDTDVERLLAANITGTNFWPASVKRKSGAVDEMRWQQAVVEHVLPQMAASSSLDRKDVCPTCHRGGFQPISFHPRRFFYHAKDLVDVQDFNLSWEWLGEFGKADELHYERWSHPLILVTPKVMNLLRGKTKKEQKYQGCDFIPIWVEGETR